jgi:hypothetical protein
MRSLFSVSLRYGAIAGVLSAALAIGLYYMGRHPFLFPVYTDFRIFVFAVFIFFTLKELRDFHYEKTLSFWQGMIASFVLTLAFAVVASSALGVFGYLVPSFLSDYIRLSTEQLRSLPQEVIDRIGKDVYERNLKMLPSTNAFELVKLYFTQSLIIAFFISIILSLILRRQPKT